MLAESRPDELGGRRCTPNCLTSPSTSHWKEADQFVVHQTAFPERVANRSLSAGREQAAELEEAVGRLGNEGF